MQTEVPGSPTVKEQTCPDCQHTIVVHQGFVAWCEQCGWNLQPQLPEKNAQNLLGKMYDRMYEKMGQRFGQSLYQQVVKEQAVKPKFGLTRFALVLLSLPVLVLTMGLILVGAYELVTGWPHVYAFFWAVICFGLAWMMRPRLTKMPKKILPRAEFQTLYRIIDEISALFGTTSVAGIVVDDRFNASFQQIGWRRKKLISLGVPLLAILDGEETVALLAHEIAHGVNGDTNRSLWIGSALSMIDDWYYLLYPVKQSGTKGIAFFGALIGGVVTKGVRALLSMYGYLLMHLGWRDSQRAEYLADSLAAEASGTGAMIRLLDKMHLSGIYAFTVQRSYLKQKEISFFAEFSRQVADIPTSEWERIRRVSKMEDSRLDDTHPPTAYRIGFMESRQVEIPKYKLTQQDLQQLNQELASLHKSLEQRLMDRYKRSLYY